MQKYRCEFIGEVFFSEIISNINDKISLVPKRKFSKENYKKDFKKVLTNKSLSSKIYKSLEGDEENGL